MNDSEPMVPDSSGSYSFEAQIRAADVGFTAGALSGAGEQKLILSDELLAQFAGATCNTYSGELTLILRDGRVVAYRYETQSAREAERFAEIRRDLLQALQRFSV